MCHFAAGAADKPANDNSFDLKKRVWLCSRLFILLKMNCGVKNPQIVFNPSIFSLIGISFPSLWKSETWYHRTHFPKIPSNQMQSQLNCWLQLTPCFNTIIPSYIMENIWQDRGVITEHKFQTIISCCANKVLTIPWEWASCSRHSLMI